MDRENQADYSPVGRIKSDMTKRPRHTHRYRYVRFSMGVADTIIEAKICHCLPSVS